MSSGVSKTNAFYLYVLSILLITPCSCLLFIEPHHSSYLSFTFNPLVVRQLYLQAQADHSNKKLPTLHRLLLKLLEPSPSLAMKVALIQTLMRRTSLFSSNTIWKGAKKMVLALWFKSRSAQTIAKR